MAKAETTRDHDNVRYWAEARKRRPTRLKGADEDEILRIDFSERDVQLGLISWEESFRLLDNNRLFFLHLDKVGDGA